MTKEKIPINSYKDVHKILKNKIGKDEFDILNALVHLQKTSIGSENIQIRLTIAAIYSLGLGLGLELGGVSKDIGRSKEILMELSYLPTASKALEMIKVGDYDNLQKLTCFKLISEYNNSLELSKCEQNISLIEKDIKKAEETLKIIKSEEKKNSSVINAIPTYQKRIKKERLTREKKENKKDSCKSKFVIAATISACVISTCLSICYSREASRKGDTLTAIMWIIMNSAFIIIAFCGVENKKERSFVDRIKENQKAMLNASIAR